MEIALLPSMHAFKLQMLMSLVCVVLCHIASIHTMSEKLKMLILEMIDREAVTDLRTSPRQQKA